VNRNRAATVTERSPVVLSSRFTLIPLFLLLPPFGFTQQAPGLAFRRREVARLLVYLMPPKRTAGGNGMEILGWAKNSRMLLVKTAEWQWGSDAGDTQQVLAIDAGTGVVYEPELQAILEARKDKHCLWRIADAGFSDEKNVNILIRAKLSTALEVDETEKDVPPATLCENAEETWSFNFASGEIKQVANTLPLQLFKKSLPNQPEPRR
jgi:hypothetical protein